MIGASALLAGRLALGVTPTVESVLASLEAAESRMHDVTLAFRQVTRLKATADEQETRGELMVLRSPERFRVRFTAPV